MTTFEMRWHVRPTGKKLMNEWGYYYDETQRVLQYRYKFQQTVYNSYSDNFSSHVTPVYRNEFVWSEWTDVPEVNE